MAAKPAASHFAPQDSSLARAGEKPGSSLEDGSHIGKLRWLAPE